MMTPGAAKRSKPACLTDGCASSMTISSAPKLFKDIPQASAAGVSNRWQIDATAGATLQHYKWICPQPHTAAHVQESFKEMPTFQATVCIGRRVFKVYFSSFHPRKKRLTKIQDRNAEGEYVFTARCSPAVRNHSVFWFPSQTNFVLKRFDPYLNGKNIRIFPFHLPKSQTETLHSGLFFFLLPA